MWPRGVWRVRSLRDSRLRGAPKPPPCAAAAPGEGRGCRAPGGRDLGPLGTRDAPERLWDGLGDRAAAACRSSNLMTQQDEDGGPAAAASPARHPCRHDRPI